MNTRDSDQPIEDYLDALWTRLPGDPREARQTLTEVETHLHESAEAHEAAGLPRREAEATAVARFGDPRVVLPRLDLRDLVRPAALFGAIGLLAIGASGVLALTMSHLWGAGFVAGDLPGASYTPARCSYFQEYYPSSSCLHSAALHHTDETVVYRLAAGVLGLLVLLAWRFLPRRRPLPVGYVPVAGVVVFGGTAALLVLETLNAQSGDWTGAGQWLSAAFVSGLVAVGYAVRYYRPVGARSIV